MEITLRATLNFTDLEISQNLCMGREISEVKLVKSLLSLPTSPIDHVRCFLAIMIDHACM